MTAASPRRATKATATANVSALWCSCAGVRYLNAKKLADRTLATATTKRPARITRIAVDPRWVASRRMPSILRLPTEYPSRRDAGLALGLRDSFPDEPALHRSRPWPFGRYVGSGVAPSRRTCGAGVARDATARRRPRANRCGLRRTNARLGSRWRARRRPIAAPTAVIATEATTPPAVGWAG
jgi:hypothetical protein